jgi:hypothetical protein
LVLAGRIGARAQKARTGEEIKPTANTKPQSPKESLFAASPFVESKGLFIFTEMPGTKALKGFEQRCPS